MKTALEKNREYSDKYYQNIERVILSRELQNILKDDKIKSVLDLGCGDGGIIGSIMSSYPNKEITGVDISERRISENRIRFPDNIFLCEDVCNTSLIKNSFDLIISNQVIEHVGDDKRLVEEILKVLKKGGYLYITSVIKKPWAIYQYRNNRKFVLDPTHEREYSSKEEFLDLFKNKIRLLGVKVYPVKRKKIITFRIPGYYIIETLWRKK